MKLLVVLFLSAIVVASSIKKRPDLCHLTHSANTKDQSLCTSGGQNLWSFVSKANSCVEFYYYGCYGNDNRFFTKTQCEEVCQDKEGFSLLNIGASFG
ncbi:male accessory gland serine protease inhibitor-like [Glossina fuscipes fuscipes]